jgi:DNA-binding transcriptional LysR family regulator
MPHGKSPDADLACGLAVTGNIAVYGLGDAWIGWRGPKEDASWISESAFPHLPSVGEMNDATLQRAACAAGLGLTQLPCFLAEPQLVRRTEPVPGFDMWVLIHRDLRRNPRLRAFRDAMVCALQRHRPRLEGRAPE